MVMKMKRKKMVSAIELVSTGDVAFLLLIFFIVSTAFAVDMGLPLLLPAKESQQQAIKIKQSNVATLKITAANADSLSGLRCQCARPGDPPAAGLPHLARAPGGGQSRRGQGRQRPAEPALVEGRPARSDRASTGAAAKTKARRDPVP